MKRLALLVGAIFALLLAAHTVEAKTMLRPKKVTKGKKVSKMAHIKAAEAYLNRAKTVIKSRQKDKVRLYNLCIAKARWHLLRAFIVRRPGVRVKRAVFKNHMMIAKLAKRRLDGNDMIVKAFPELTKAPAFKRYKGQQATGRRFFTQKKYYRALYHAREAYKTLVKICTGKRKKVPPEHKITKEEQEAPASADEAGVTAEQEANPEQPVEQPAAGAEEEPSAEEIGTEADVAPEVSDSEVAPEVPNSEAPDSEAPDSEVPDTE